MRVQDEHGWIEIEFLCRARDAESYSSDLLDVKNCIEIALDFDMDDVGWGSVGFEYFYAQDIAALTVGLQSVLAQTQGVFSYTGQSPHKNFIPDLFYVFTVERQGDEITVFLKIHDCIIDYISAKEKMLLVRFAEIAQEFAEAAEKFPVI